MEKGVRVKDLDVYQGDLNRDDLSIPVDAKDFATGKRISGKQLREIITELAENSWEQKDW